MNSKEGLMFSAKYCRRISLLEDGEAQCQIGTRRSDNELRHQHAYGPCQNLPSELSEVHFLSLVRSHTVCIRIIAAELSHSPGQEDWPVGLGQ